MNNKIAINLELKGQLMKINFSHPTNKNKRKLRYNPQKK
jgi:hypothetical protein